jgi:diacylglycerol O-acyltransferase
MATLPRDPHRRLSPRLTGRRRIAWSHGLSLDHVRDTARLHGATINDIVLAAVAGAARAHLTAKGETVASPGLRAMVPVNLRPGLPDPRGPLGNRFGLVYLDLPTDLGSPHARLEAVRDRTRVLKARPDPLVSFAVLGAIGTLPATIPWATTFFAEKASLVVTNVPGPREPLHLAGERVQSAMFWVPHPVTLGLGVSVLTYAGQVQIGVRADAAVLADPSEFVTSFEEEIALLGGTGSQRRAS